MRLTLIVFIYLISFNIFASPDECKEEKPEALAPVLAVIEQVAETPCSDPKKLRGLCMNVGAFDEEPEPSGRYIWTYQRKILEAACVDLEKDSEEVIAQKISRVWNENEDSLVCSSTRFDVPRGNILKFAVNMKFTAFIGDMIQWKVNLNKVDATDNKTVLDYIEDQIQRNKGYSVEQTLNMYYRVLREAGAKHRREL